MEEKEQELYIPFWALPFNELMVIFGSSLSDANREYIRSKIVDAKKYVQKNFIWR